MRERTRWLATSKRLGTVTVLAIANFGTVALAQQIPSAPTAQPVAKPAAELPLETIISRVKEQGYSDIEEIEREAGSWEICAKDAKGKKVELKVNASTGVVESVEPDDD